MPIVFAVQLCRLKPCLADTHGLTGAIVNVPCNAFSTTKTASEKSI